MNRIETVVRRRPALRGWIGCAAALATAASSLGQPTAVSPLAPPPNGPRKADPAWHALTNATIHVRPGHVIDKGVVVIRDGLIMDVSPMRDGWSPPAGARTWDCTGLHIYPGFIDAFVEVDAPSPGPDSPGVHWSAKVTPQRAALDGAGVDARTGEALRKLGFTAAAISPKDGIFRGTAAVVSLAKTHDDASAERPPVYARSVFQTIGLESGGGRGGDSDVSRWGSYPNSLMGCIALIRQTFIDADWQAAGGAADLLDSGDDPPIPNCLTSLADRSTLLLFDAGDELEVLRAAKIAREFGRPAMLLGSGYEFRRLDAVASEGLAIITPVNFPKAPDVSSLGRVDATSLRDLMTWEQAPTNPRRLDEAGLDVALTTARLRDRAEFSANLERAIKHGLPTDRALAMLTTTPAELLGVSASLGAVERGKVANLVIADGRLFEPPFKKPAPETTPPPTAPDPEPPELAIDPEDKPGERLEPTPPTPTTPPAPAEARPERPARGAARGAPGGAPPKVKIRDVWIDGIRHEINAAPDEESAGTWVITTADGQQVDPDAPKTPRIIVDKSGSVTIQAGDEKAKATKARVEKGRIDFVYDGAAFGIEGMVTDAGVIDGDEMLGVSLMPDGGVHRWAARRRAPEDEPRAGKGLTGRWDMTRVDGQPSTDGVVIAILPDKTVTLTSREGETHEPDDARVEGDTLSYTVDMSRFGAQGSVAVRATREGDTLRGSMAVPDGGTHTFEAVRIGSREPDIAETPDLPGYPFGPYAVKEPPAAEPVVLTNATIWTSGPEGVIENGWLFIRDGKVESVGRGGPPGTFGDVRIIDCAGKHITPGLIDCHSHTGISRGVNESGQAVTAEVRIGDVTNPDSINWYRQLAGGITSVNSLHGSANPIGGQSQTNKVRWGVPHPDGMHFEGARPGIKFALGENVKQSNWGASATSRYPRSRMGVETLIRDRFTAAREYAERHGIGGRGIDRADFEGQRFLGSGAPGGRFLAQAPPRRDLELEALAEVLAGERLVHCHSYRQDEILMLCRVAGDFGFTIGTFQHILEGYKVADEIRRHAVGASAFSDWWAYKVEVQDAIGEAGAIMHEQGVNVSFNSDSDELARRMNVEAAKAVKYGGVAPEEALKFVTINPAIQLGIDRRVGSLEKGKDADLAVWSGPPLSSLSRCEATYIDGRRYFSLADDLDHRERIAAERRRLIQKIQSEGVKKGDEAGEKKQPDADTSPDDPPEGLRERMIREYYLDLHNRGLDAGASRRGECGCGEWHVW